MALYQEDLDSMICSSPGCDHTSHDSEMYLHSLCHPNDPTWSHYQAGQLTVFCAVCEKPIAVIAVASKETADA